MMRRAGLSLRVTLFTTLGLAVGWVLAVLVMTSVMWAEQEEMFDLQLADTAHVLLPLLSQISTAPAGDLRAPQALPGLDEALIYRLIGPQGRVLRAADLADAAVLPDVAPDSAPGYATGASYRSYFTGFNARGHGVQLAAPLAERREAFRESILGFLGPMLALLPLTWLMVGWIARRSLAPLQALRTEIAARDGSRLEMIDASDWPEDLTRIAGALNGFMAQLSQALEAERAFATNAAHELRTPVAIALAQVQQLRAETQEPAQIARIVALERALQRMRRLVARLLQLARADAGIGLSDEAHDLVALTRLVLADFTPRTAPGQLSAGLSTAPVPARIDPDAFAIVLGNLIENALQHGPDGGTVHIALRAPAVLEVSSGGAVVAAPGALSGRFRRRGGEGFGLGLHICGQILSHAGGSLELLSPAPGRQDGFMARVSLPV